MFTCCLNEVHGENAVNWGRYLRVPFMCAFPFYEQTRKQTDKETERQD